MVSMQFLLLLAGLALACFTPDGLGILLFIALGMVLWGFWSRDPHKKLMGGALALAGLILVPLVQGMFGQSSQASTGPSGPIAMAQPPPPVVDPTQAASSGVPAVQPAGQAPTAVVEQPAALPPTPTANAPATPARRVGNSTDLSNAGIPVMPPPAKAPPHAP